MSTVAEVESVAVQGDVALRLSVRGAEDGAAASFEIKKAADDSVVTTVQGEVLNGIAVGQWDPDITPDGEERSLRVYYIVTVGEQTVRSQELEVYLDWVEITSVDEQAAALPDVPYRLTVGDDVREGTTGSTGIARESGLPAGEVHFEWRGPYQLVEWVDEKGPTRKAKLERVQRMKLEWPNPEGNGGRRAWQEDGTEVELDPQFHAWTQWVNCPYDATTEAGRACGPRLRCRVRAAEPEHAAQGEKVYVKVEWPPAAELSPRDDPPRLLVEGADRPWAQGETQKGLELEFPEAGGLVEFEVQLGLAGGDRVTIHVGGSDRCEDVKLVVTNRRKVFYALTRLEHQALPDLAAATGWLDAASIEVAQEGPDQLLSGAPEVQGPPGRRGMTRVPASWLEGEGAAGERLVVGRHNFDWFTTKFPNASGQPRTVHLVLADAIITPTQSDDCTDIVRTFEFTWTPGQGLSEFIPMPAAVNHELFERSIGDGGPPVRGATWRTPNARTVDRRFRNKSGPVAEDWLRVQRHRVEARTRGEEQVTCDGRTGAWITLPGDSLPAQALAAGVEVTFTGSMHIARVGQHGLSQGVQMVVEADGDAALTNFIFAHELGHNMRQAAYPNRTKTDQENATFYLPPGLRFDQHHHGFDGRGFEGSHCSFGLADAGATHVALPGEGGELRYEALSGSALEHDLYPQLRKQVGDEYQKVAGTCVMYGGANEETARDTIGFCEDCLLFLEGGALEDLHKSWSIQALGDLDGAPADPQPVPAELRVQLLDTAGKPCANTAYDLTMPSGRAASGQTDAGGWLQQELQDADRVDGAARLRYTPEGAEAELVVSLHLTATMDDDCDSDAVCLAHLRNLGFLGADEPQAAGVSRFQETAGLPPTGTLDEETKDALDELVRTEDSLEERISPAVEEPPPDDEPRPADEPQDEET